MIIIAGGKYVYRGCPSWRLFLGSLRGEIGAIHKSLLIICLCRFYMTYDRLEDLVCEDVVRSSTGALGKASYVAVARLS